MPFEIVTTRNQLSNFATTNIHRNEEWKMECYLKNLIVNVISFALLCHIFSGFAVTQSITENAGAWHNGRFQVEVASVIGRSDIVLHKPNLESIQAMPLGNGRLGVAIWSANGLTAQLNRADTLPDRLSPGQIVIPGLTSLTSAKDYLGRLDLYHGEFREKGGGMTATAYVEPDTDTLIVDVTGAQPDETQTALLKLWAPRTPQALAEKQMGLLFESWLDDKDPQPSGRPFGSLSAITAQGRDVSAAITDPLTITIAFKPYADGHFRIVVAAPHYEGKGTAKTVADQALSVEPVAAHELWWHDLWERAAVIKITSKDGAGEYMENLRNIYLFVAAIEKGVEYPGSQAGVADMVSGAQDIHRWAPSSFWHWNLRMQVAANIGAGLPDLNDPYFNLYRENLTNMEGWTRKHMKGLPGICVPETMRFNGQGIEYNPRSGLASVGMNCDASFKPYYNARTLTTGAEVSLWIWQQYVATDDRKFLSDNYPLIAASARFLLASQTMGKDGLLHTGPSNSHETQWDVTDPTTDIAAITALYPVTIQAANMLGKDADLVAQLQAASLKIPSLPRTKQTGPRYLLPSDAADDGTDVIAESYQPGAEAHNIENIGLEAVWPYGNIGDTSPLFSLAQRTYAHRPYPEAVDWSYDPIQAARLGLGIEVGSTLIHITQKFQHFVNGLSKWEAADKEFYVEQTGVVADAIQESLVQDYDGVIRLAPAIPPGWDFDGTVCVNGNTRVDLQTRNGVVTTVVLEAGTTGQIKFRNPWPGKAVDVISGKTSSKVEADARGTLIQFPGIAGTNYLVEPRDQPPARMRFTPVRGRPASSAKMLGLVQIGLD